MHVKVWRRRLQALGNLQSSFRTGPETYGAVYWRPADGIRRVLETRCGAPSNLWSEATTIFGPIIVTKAGRLADVIAGKDVEHARPA